MTLWYEPNFDYATFTACVPVQAFRMNTAERLMCLHRTANIMKCFLQGTNTDAER